MADPSLPSLPSLVASARAVFGVLFGATLRHDGTFDWREVPREQAVFGAEVSRFAGIAVGLLHGDESIRSHPPCRALDFLAQAFRDPRVVRQIVELARQVDSVRGVASSRGSETLH